MQAAAVMTAQSNKMQLSEKIAGGPREKANCGKYRHLLNISSIAACIVMLVLDVELLSGRIFLTTTDGRKAAELCSRATLAQQYACCFNKYIYA